ncbi:MAG TPA: DUF6603 domain-containing protein [Candidatus Angelobacter sp.]
MSDGKGTLQAVFREIGILLSPLSSGLAAHNAPEFFASLGIVMTSAQASSLAAPFSSVATDIGDLISKIEDLIDADNEADMIAKAAGAAVKVAAVIKDFANIATAVSGIPGVTPAIVNALPDRIFNLLLADYVGRNPGINEGLEFMGILERQDFNVDSTDPNQPFYTLYTFHFDRIGGWLQNPGAQMSSLYDWNTPAFDGKKILQALENLIVQLGLPAVYDPTGPSLDLMGLQIVPKTDVSPKGLALRLQSNAGSAAIEFDGNYWTFTITIAFGLASGAEVVVQPDGTISIKPPDATTVSGDVGLKYAYERTSDNPLVILGSPGSSRLEIQKFEFNLGGGFTWDGSTAHSAFSTGGSIGGGKLVISFDQADGFLGSILGGVHAESDFDLGFGYSTDHGFSFTGAATLQIQIPLHLDLGPVSLSALTLSGGIQGQKFPVGLALDINASLGPLQASVQQVGLEIDFALKDDRSGNAGPVDVSVEFKPPKGAGLSIDTGIVVGGGFLSFDPDKGEYAGVAELSIADVVTVKAIGLITTKMPDGSSGFSLLLILTTDFPPIQLGFGFTLNGVGGLLGLNRSVQLDVLRDGVRTGAVDEIMFPTDIIANAPRIISDLRTIFPPQQNVFLVGPMAQFGWGDPSLVTLSLGIIIEIPPGNIAILGVLRVALPTEDEALILIQVAFLGILDFDEQLLSFDASLYDSHVLFMTLEGDMAVRLKWGDNAAFILSVGGFHPAFHPPDGLHLPASMKRLSISILDYDWAKIKVDCYFAVTSNTVQFGAHLYLFFGVDSANITGQLGLDVLFQFSPFMFIAQMSGSLSIAVFGMDLLSISLNFQLSGPTPWEAKGTGSLSILFFSIDVSFDVTWGDKKDTTLPPVDVMPIFLGEVNKQSNWKALPPPSTNLLVTLRAVDPSLLVLHPFGSLTLSQRALPLKLKLDTVGNQEPDDVNVVDIPTVSSNPGGGAPVTVLTLNDEDEQFAIAQYQDMSDSDKLSRPSYQQLKGGVIIGSSDSMQSSKMTRRTINYNATIIDKDPQQPVFKGRMAALSGLFHPFLSGSAAARSPLSYKGKAQIRPFTDTIAVGQEGYAVSNTSDNKPVNTASNFSSEAMARDYMKSHVASNPSLAAGMHVLPNSEVNA